ncbi:peptidase inhibitor family I36 protein [Nonomuraea sp. SBT364]|uniref:peptidase inhibitor family I36 protein n=1 Tax=Nonomuraea sp. SBT364 TaxID=1580530 RepID=UPI00066CE390|nr:peptidase inhibitor family I36 protein [Nonomuraea sp. SBT364]
MRKFTVTAMLLGLATLGVTVPVTAAQAAGTSVAGGCDDDWGPRNGNMYAWQDLNCEGTLLISTPGNSSYWGASATDKASSVMNRGFTGGRDAVKFYENINHGGGHTCLLAGELYADNLTDNRFSNGVIVNDRITSHKWVTAGECTTILT